MYVKYENKKFQITYADMDNFIVDENGEPIKNRLKKKKHIIHSDS